MHPGETARPPRPPLRDRISPPITALKSLENKGRRKKELLSAETAPAEMPDPEADGLPREVSVILQRVTILSEQDQLLAYETIRDYLIAGGKSVPADEQLDERGQALRVMRAVMEHYRLGDPRELEVKQFDAAPEEVREGWKSGRIIRVWVKWKFARDALAGSKPRPTARQRAVRSKARVRDVRSDDYLAGVREWLATKPPKLVIRDYDAWVTERNAARSADTLPVARYLRIHNALTLSWKSILRAASGEITVEEARKEVLTKRVSISRAPHDLISSQEIQTMTGKPEGTVQRWMKGDSFPVPALVIGNRRFWIREDIELFVQGKKHPSRKRNELGDVYVTLAGASAILGVHRYGAAKLEGAPEAVALVGADRLWLKSEIEAFGEARRARTTDRLGRRLRKPNQDGFSR